VRVCEREREREREREERERERERVCVCVRESLFEREHVSTSPLSLWDFKAKRPISSSRAPNPKR
jgi:hypothetical protein